MFLLHPRWKLLFSPPCDFVLLCVYQMPGCMSESSEQPCKVGPAHHAPCTNKRALGQTFEIMSRYTVAEPQSWDSSLGVSRINLPNWGGMFLTEST